MRLYEGTTQDFDRMVSTNAMVDQLENNFRDYYRHLPSPSEMRAWRESLNFLNNAVRYASIPDTCIVVEYELPFTSQRIDAMLFGKQGDADRVVLIELKQWSNDNVHLSDNDGNVVVDFGRRIEVKPHPSLQVEGYHFGVMDFVEVFTHKSNPMLLDSCVYCHNYSKVVGEMALLDQSFEKMLNSFPVFGKEDVKQLGEYLHERLQSGRGLEVLNRFTASSVKPSKKLLDHTGDMIHKQQIFTLIDDQIAAYNAILSRAKNLSKQRTKSVIVIKGGPGTGKSVIALEVMGELMRRRQSVFHATGSSAFTNTLRKIVGPRAKTLFKFFNSFMTSEPDSIDVLVCDEAHRIRETSNNMYTARVSRSDVPQIEELLRVAKLSIFFIDEYQIVRPNEIGNVQLIKDAARKMGVTDKDIEEFELKTQFRCSGSDAYLQWLDNLLGVRELDLAYFDPKMEFKIFDDPQMMLNEIRQRNLEKQNSARIIAGFCWPWSKPNIDGSLVRDVKIGDFAMPWEKKDTFWQWATDSSGMEQVGTVYTAQGFEFDYVGVIIGKDLVYRKGMGWIAQPEFSHDSATKRGNGQLANHLKHVYRVLLSRAHKGVYVYFMDEETRHYFEDQLSK